MNFRFLFVTILIVFMASCSENENPNGFDFGTEEEFEINKSYTSESSLLSFSITNIGDSRCPTGVYCIWAGEAVVTVVIDQPQADTIVVSTHDPKIATSGSFEFEIIDLTPYPDINTEIRREDYRVIMEIRK